ncbi:unnamed protein product [Alopecurus aequalis]
MSSSQLPSWPGLPRGVHFNPSDSDLLWHLAAEIGNGRAHRHPFINKFIKSGDEDGGFGRTHPEDMLGMSKDGHASYFFHKKVELCNWQQSGASSIILDGSLEGCKDVFVLTDWELHQFRMKNRMEDEGELVVSKIFYKSQNNPCEWAAKAPVQSAQDDSVTYNDSKQEKEEAQLANHPVSMATDSYFVEGNGNEQEQMLVETYPDQDTLSSCKDVLDTKHINHENEINQAETELDHMSLQERYRILLANKHAARVSAETCAGNDSDSSSMQMDAITNEPVPKSESEINLEGTTNMEDIRSMLQAVSSAPSITGSMDADSNVRNSGTYLVDVKMEPALEGYAIHPSESSCVRSIVKKTHTGFLNCNEDLLYCSRQRKKREIAMDSSEKVLEEDAYKDDEGIAPSRRRKKKTATDSIETALEEDAPGLLQILLDRGIAVKEIKLYDVGEDDEMLADCTESDFQDLENVISKLFPQRASLLKSAARYGKGGGKAIYCLACLISLIEQFRDCPVEWGWCRDLQSFIFVFRSHNRLVLERPEYGYATYFFEIVQSVPVEWQIRRLVTAMKLSNCGRTALIENRPLSVGEDLSEGEAKVLEEYGWIRNTGLGTMLNYRDRVVHDRWNEKYSTDWRMKIGKLLMNGYSEGHLIITHSPSDMLSEEEIKLEDPV